MLDSATGIIVLLNLCLLFYIIVRHCAVIGSKKNFPPGPIGLPFVGYLPFLSNKYHLDFMRLGQKYGDVFSIRLGSRTVIVLHGSDAIKEAFSKLQFMDKPPKTLPDYILPKSPFLAANFRCWREQRKFVEQVIKELGLRETKIQCIQEEIQLFLEALRAFQGEPIDPKEPLSPSIGNNMSSLVFGKEYHYDNPNRQYLDQTFGNIMDKLISESPYNFFPWIRHVPFNPKLLKLEGTLTAVSSLQNFIRKEVKKYEQCSDSQNSHHFIGKYILEMKSRKEKDSSTTFTDETMIYTLRDILVAGSDTTIATIMWCIYHVATYQEIQKKIKEEINSVIGVERKPHYLDQKNMPYTQAVILETLRWNPTSPLSFLLYTTENTTVGGYDIPKGTSVFANFWNAHHDTRYWTEPEAFMPERFLDSDGKTVVKNNNFMAFSTGRRVCPGETLAKIQIFLYVTSILQKFTVEFAEDLILTSGDPNTKDYRPEQKLLKFLPNNFS